MTFLKGVLKSFRFCRNFSILLIFAVTLMLYIVRVSYLHSRIKEEIPSFSFIKQSFQGQILIHFDFKGAPPKVSYLTSVIPTLRMLGATGIILEYEDMFPYDGDLQDIKAFNAYSPSDISAIVETAEKSNLTIIPLVQTLGHLEFVLKLKQYKYLREVVESPEVLCPSHINAYFILQKMINQVMGAHPNAKYFHIGCDEANNIGMCSKCQDLMKRRKWRKDDLYFSHIKKIAKYIISTYPRVQPLVWGDRFLRNNEKIITSHGIPDLVEVMFWNYKFELNSFPQTENFKSYARMFKNIWIASAFKGATGSVQLVTDPDYHLKNTKAWMRIVSQWKEQIRFKGIALTGWQRYNHFSALCDLFPVAIPSLSLNLMFLKKSEDLDYDELKHSLGCNDFVPVNLQESLDTALISRLKCDFPGYRIYQTIHLFYNKLQECNLLLDSLKGGGFSFNNIIQNGTSREFIKQLYEKKFGKRLLEINELENEIKTALSGVYDEQTVNEWIITHMMPVQMRLEAAAIIISNLFRKNDWTQRPIQYDTATIRKFFNKVCNPIDTIGCSFFNIH